MCAWPSQVLRYSPPLDPRLDSLFRLDKERLLLEYVKKEEEKGTGPSVTAGGGTREVRGGDGDGDSDKYAEATKSAGAAPRQRYALSGGLPQKSQRAGATAAVSVQKATGSTALASLASGAGRTAPLLVIMRHGKTDHNKLGLFTGAGWPAWASAPTSLPLFLFLSLSVCLSVSLSLSVCLSLSLS